MTATPTAGPPGHAHPLGPAHRRSGPAGPLLAVTAAVVVANILYLAGIFNPDPIYQLTGLGSAPPSALLPGTDTIDPNNGFTAQALGHLAASDWLHGRIPWWNPFEGLGSPLAGEMQSAALFPLVLLYALSGGQVWFHLVLELVAGHSTYFLLRRLVRSPWAATAGAVAFALDGTFSWLSNASANPVAFLPLLLLGVEQCLDRDRRGWTGWPLVAVAVALSIYAGFPEMAFIDGLLALVWLGVRASELVVADLVVLLRRGAAGLVVGLLLAAPLLVAFLTYLPHADLGRHLAGYSQASQPARLALPVMVMPYVFGPIFGGFAAHQTAALSRFWGYAGGYLGTALVALAVMAVPGRRDRRLRLALAVWVILGVARSVGVPVIQQAVDAVPGVANTIFFRYAFPSWSLALAVLAAFAIDDRSRRRPLAGSRRPSLAVPATAVAVLLLLGALAVPAIGQLRQSHYIAHAGVWSVTSAAGALAVLVAVCAGALWRRPGLMAAALACETVALFVVPQLSAPRRVALDTGPVRYLQAHLGSGRFFTLGPVAPDYGSYWHLRSLADADNPVPQPFADLITRRLDPNADPLVFNGASMLHPTGPTPAQEFARNLAAYRAAGVRYLVSYSSTDLPPGLDLPVVYRDPQVTIRRVPGAAPLYSTTAGCRIAAVSAQVTVDCAGPGRLVRRELYLPGWTATDGGTPVAVQRWGSVYEAVALHPGPNRVGFSFTPPHEDPAAAAGLVGVAALVGAAAAGPVRRRGRGRRGRAAPRRY